MQLKKHNDPDHGIEHVAFQQVITARRVDVEGHPLTVLSLREKSSPVLSNVHLSDQNAEQLRDQLIALYPLKEKAPAKK